MTIRTNCGEHSKNVNQVNNVANKFENITVPKQSEYSQFESYEEFTGGIDPLLLP